MGLGCELRYNYVLTSNYLFIHYTMSRVTNMLSDSARKKTERDNVLSRPAVRVLYHPIVSREKTCKCLQFHIL